MSDDFAAELANAMGIEQPEEVVEEVVVEEVVVDEDLVDESVESEDVEAVVDSLDALAEANEWPIEELYKLNVAMPGEEDPIPLGELKNRVADARLREIKSNEEAVKMRDELAKSQQVAQQHQQLDQNQQQMMSQVMAIDGYLKSPEFQQLKASDPGQAALRHQEAMTARQQIGGQMQQYAQQMGQQQEQQRQEGLQRSSEYLTKQIPEWADPVVAQSEKKAIADAFTGYGYDGSEVSQITDPRAVMIMRDNIRLKAQIEAGVQAGKVVQQAPKANLRHGRGITRKQQEKMQLGKVLKKAQGGSRSDRVDAAAALIAAAGGI